jgi:hypothetical protein
MLGISVKEGKGKKGRDIERAERSESDGLGEEGGRGKVTK